MSIWFIFALIVLTGTIVLSWAGLSRKDPEPLPADTNPYGSKVEKHNAQVASSEAARSFGKFSLVAGGIFFAVLMALSMLYTQSVGQGVIVVRVGGSVISADTTPGLGMKAPWDKAHKWDLFTRDISLAGNPEKDTFDAGEIVAGQIATSVKSGSDSGAQVWYNLDATYNIDNADLKALYSQYRDQDRFTRQVVYPAIQKAARSVPSQYTTTEFRGAGSVEAGDKIAETVNNALEADGVIITVATVKDVNFTEKVEASLSVVEEKQQQEEAAIADAAAKQVQNTQLIKDAKAKAEANKLEADSLTPELLQLRKIEGYKKGDVFYVPEGTDVSVLSGK